MCFKATLIVIFRRLHLPPRFRQNGHVTHICHIDNLHFFVFLQIAKCICPKCSMYLSKFQIVFVPMDVWPTYAIWQSPIFSPPCVTSFFFRSAALWKVLKECERGRERVRVTDKNLNAFVHQEFTDLLEIYADIAFLHNDHHCKQSRCNKNAMLIKNSRIVIMLVEDLWKAWLYWQIPYLPI